MSPRLSGFLGRHGPLVERALEASLPRAPGAAGAILEPALHAAVFSGGKRMRPMLTLMAAEALEVPLGVSLPAACAVEMLHASSLILDDLPCMDDADLRRGRPALHRRFGEAAALLAALALLNRAYALLADAAEAAGGAGRAAELVREASRCVGAEGAVGGQAVDVAPRQRGAEEAVLEARNLKTTALMRLSLVAAPLAAGADAGDLDALARFGAGLGAAYQVADDCLDLEADGTLGKTAGQDARHDRPSYAAALGAGAARALAVQRLKEAKSVLRRRLGHRPGAAVLAEAADAIIGAAGRSRPVLEVLR